MQWNGQQLAAIETVHKRIAEQEPVTRLFGYAGVGKTTLAKELASTTDGLVLFAAYTGKAASVLTRKGCRASTIHSLIYQPSGDVGVKLNEVKRKIANIEAASIVREVKEEEAAEHTALLAELKKLKKKVNSPGFVFDPEGSPLKDASLLVLDEVSMVDDAMAKDLLSFDVPILALGDPAQLPPVGGHGYFTRVSPDILLTTIERHVGLVVDLATRVRTEHARLPLDGTSVRRRISLREAAEFDQVLVGTNATRWKKNRALRSHAGFPEADLIVPGDRIICTANNKDIGVLNGQQFRVMQVTGTDGDKAEVILYCECEPPVDDSLFGTCVICGWRTRPVPLYTSGFQGTAGESELKEMPYSMQRRAMQATYGYAITVHKSQGSEWQRVLVVDESPVFRRNAWRWLYTAITRAQSEVVVIR